MARTVPALPLWHPATLIATWFSAGLLPWAPGTWGSLAALPFAWAIMISGGPIALLVAAVLVFLIGWWASKVYLKGSNVKDPSEIVVDEVSGQWLALVAANPGVWWHWLLGFALFRLFDITKPWPARALDRRPDSLGVMADDTAAGVYALIVLTVVIAVVHILRGLAHGA